MDNELLDLAYRLCDVYGKERHWEILKAEKTGRGTWVLTVQEQGSEAKGAENENKE